MTAETVAEPTVFVAGARYRVNRDHPQGARLNEGDTIQAISLDGTVWRVSRIGESDTPETRMWGVYATDVTPLPGFADRRIAELEAALAESNRLLESERATRRADTERWISDIQHINDVLVDEAESRDWCGDFDHIVENRINGPLRYELAGRTFEHEMQRERYVRVRVTQTGTYSGSQSDSDNLDEDDVSWNDLDTNAILTAVRNGAWDDEDETVDDSFCDA